MDIVGFSFNFHMGEEATEEIFSESYFLLPAKSFTNWLFIGDARLQFTQVWNVEFCFSQDSLTEPHLVSFILGSAQKNFSPAAQENLVITNNTDETMQNSEFGF